jgi:FecR protein
VRTVNTRTQTLISLFFFCTVLVAGPVFGQNADPPGRVARLSYMEGAVSFEPAGENNWSQASLNYPLTTGDRLWTDKGARAELETGNIAIRMSEQTDLTTTNLTDQLLQLGLAQGSLRITAYDLRPGGQVEVDTPNAAVTIVQAGSYRLDTYPDQSSTLVTVNRGEVQITGNGLNETLRSGQVVMLTGSNPAQAAAVSVPAPDSFDQWCAQRDGKYQNARSRQYVSPYVPGYYDLDGYGSWTTVAAYGPIWYPAGIPVGWCPYRYGRWAWVEPWGWTWVDSAPWGFAPFHYGRWVQIGVRWGWLPGPIAVAPIYGPAFVAFVGGAGFSVGFGVGGVAAWFPLGPGEPFFPWYHHSNVYLQQVNITNVRNINITNITNITNINNIHYRYQTVATTAVNANAFRNSEPVAPNLVKVNPQQLQRAQVIPHPEINPTSRALAAGGATTVRPPVNVQRPMVVQHSAAVNRPGQPATAARTSLPENTPPNANIAHMPTPNEHNVPQPPSSNERLSPSNVPHGSPPTNERAEIHGPPPPTRPALVARTPPPQEKLPYEQKMPAMEQHPGRPLEPQQKENLHAGQPAGPMLDPEFPPHAAPAVRAAPPPHGQSAPHGEPSKH